jgi:hypothetical protein
LRKSRTTNRNTHLQMTHRGASSINYSAKRRKIRVTLAHCSASHEPHHATKHIIIRREPAHASLPKPVRILGDPAVTTVRELNVHKSVKPAMSKTNAAADLLGFVQDQRFATILADPPWQFTNKTGKVAPEHKRLSRYGTMKLNDIMALPLGELVAPTAHLYLWCPNAMLPEGLAVMEAWGFTYKTHIVWHKVRA